MASPLTTSPLHPRACPVCGEQRTEPAGTREDGGTFQACVTCSLVYLSPAPDDAALARFYASYYTDYRRLQAPARADIESAARAGHVDALTRFALQTAGGAPDRVADVGCGQGARLVALRALGSRHVAGSEMDPEAARFAKDAYDITVHTGSADAVPLGDSGFDLVFLAEVIEHVLDPVALLRAVRRLVRPGGLLCLSTPNAGVRHRAGSAWAQLHLDFDHLTLFDDASLRRALRAADLAPLEVLTHGRPALSSERWREAPLGLRLPPLAQRGLSVARRLAANVRTPRVELDPHEGYSLLCSARRMSKSETK